MRRQAVYDEMARLNGHHICSVPGREDNTAVGAILESGRNLNTVMDSLQERHLPPQNEKVVVHHLQHP
jgi:hypothetical protein